MGRATAQSCLTPQEFVASGLTYRRAGPQDDEDLRAILRANIMDGWVKLSFEREPHYFRTLYAGEHHEVIIGRDLETGEPAGMFARTAQQIYVNGKVRRLGYLGELRVVRERRHRIRHIRDGFNAIDQLLPDPSLEPYCLTSIVADNAPARRLLEAGVKGLPTYQPFADLTTLVFSTRARVPAGTCDVATGTKKDEEDVLDCLRRNGARRQFAPVWTREDVTSAERGTAPGLDDFLIARRAGRVVGCLALWDQSPARQVVVRGYERKIAQLRPLLNALSPLLRLPHMPAEGRRLKQVFLSHMAIDDDHPETLISLLGTALKQAKRLGHELALLGLAKVDPLLGPVQAAVRARQIESKVYLVYWPSAARNVPRFDGRTPQFEIGLM